MTAMLPVQKGSAAAAKRARATAALLLAVLVVLAVAPAQAAALMKRFAVYDPHAAVRVDHSVWDRLLKTYVSTDAGGLNRLDYAAFGREGHAALKQYLARLQKIDPATLNRPEQFAFWVNLYNAKTVDLVLEHYPLKSIRDIRLGGLFSSGPWRARVMEVAGVALSLDDIEHRILRPIWRDPRVHYAVNCASVGCPNLLREAYTGAHLNRMLNRAAHEYINSPRGVRIEKGRAIVSSIYKWYMEDFGGSVSGVLAHLRKHAGPGLAQALERVTQIAGYAYDWRLNDKK